jgi:DNA-binding CsgD family transcriptional regulator
MLFSPEELEKHPFNAELINKIGFRWYCGALVTDLGGHLVTLSVERRRHREPFSFSEMEAVRSLLEPLRRAANLAMAVANSRVEGTLDALDRMNCAAFILDGRGSVIRLNAEAERHLGNGIRMLHGELKASHRIATANLQRLISATCALALGEAASAPAAIALPREHGRPLVCYGTPLIASARDLFRQARAIIMLLDPDRGIAAAQTVLQQAFALTPAEARLSACLGRGQTLEQAAKELKITYATARSELKGVFVKLGVSRQSELVALLAKTILA